VAIETSKRDPIRVEAAEGEVPTDKAVVAQAPVVAPGDRRKAPPRLRRPSAHRDPSLAFTGPVRVRLQRINCDAAKPYPPQGVTREWWQRLKDALGTASNAFVHSSLIQLIEAARLPRAGISEMAVNASLAFIENAKPKDEVESALLIQMACTHTAAMTALGAFAATHGHDRSATQKASAASRLLRAYTAQVETLRRLRHGGSQFVRVEHVQVNEGGQALIGNVRKNGSGGEGEK
jgi:hypothetical protein